MKEKMPQFKSLEHALRRIRQDPFMDMLPDSLLVVDPGKRVVYMNEQASVMLGIPRDAAMGRPCWEVLRSPICEGCHDGEDDEHVCTADFFNIDVVDRFGQIRACCLHSKVLRGESGEVLGYLDSFREMGQVREIIEEQERLLGLYNYEKEKAQSLVNAIGDGVFTVGLELRIESFSPRLEELTGYRVEEVLGRTCAEVFRRRDSCLFAECPILQMKKGGMAVRNVRHPIFSASGESIPILFSSAPLMDQNGGLMGAVGIVRDIREVVELRNKLQESYGSVRIVGHSHKLEAVFDLVDRVADTRLPVLIQGESGTGKELVARAIHERSSRDAAPFVKINCAALPDPLLESELFGYEKGAFTGALRSKPGKFKLADGGTVLLDEIAETSPAFQAKLLRVLQDHSFEPLGGTRTEKVDVRILAATNKNLKSEVACGRFREDLYYRICVVPAWLPPLRERAEDVPLLVNHFLGLLKNRYPETHARSVSPSPAAMKRLMEYSWPGNVRELRNVVERAYFCCESGVIDVQSLPDEIAESREYEDSWPETPSPFPDDVSGSRYKDPQVILRTLKKHRGNRSRAARELGISRTTLWRKIRELETHGGDGLESGS